MNTRLLALGAATVLTAASLTGCAVRLGPMTSSSPDIDDATAVVLDTAGDLTIREGEPSLTIHAPQGVLDRLTVRVRDGVLELGHRGGPFPIGNADIRYELTLPSLTSIEVNGAGDVDATVSGDSLAVAISGAGDVEVSGIDADAVEVRIDGAGDVELSGEAASLDVAIDGTGEVDTDDLRVRDASVAISGAGDAHVYVTGTLRVELSGVGSVRHRGGADVESEISGLGEVIAED